jgi:RNA polymerase primary sigma factor
MILEVYLEEINRVPLLTAGEEKDLALRVAEGDAAARDHMIRANLRLVVRVARFFLGRGVELEDLIQSGNMGLLTAVRRFDPAAGTRLSTYATYWIKRHIIRFIQETRDVIRVPAYAQELLRSWRMKAEELQNHLGRTASEAEVAGSLGLSARRVKVVESALRAKRVDVRDGHEQIVLFAFAEEDEVAFEGPSRLLSSLRFLGERERLVVRRYFGFDGEPETFASIGRELGVSRERVRQVYVKALEKLQGILLRAGPAD